MKTKPNQTLMAAALCGAISPTNDSRPAASVRHARRESQIPSIINR